MGNREAVRLGGRHRCMAGRQGGWEGGIDVWQGGRKAGRKAYRCMARSNEEGIDACQGCREAVREA